MMDDKKIVYGTAVASIVVLTYHGLKVRAMKKSLNAFMADGREKIDALYQIAVDIEFEDITRDLDI